MRLVGAIFATILLNFACGGTIQADGLNGLSSADVAKIQSVQSVDISPNGKWIAIRLAVPRIPGLGDDGSAWTELHLVNAETKQSRPFITGEVSIGEIQWSGDSQKIFYAAKRLGDEHVSLYQIPVDGGESRKILTHTEAVKGFDVRPDGTQIAFLAAENRQKEIENYRSQGFNQQIYEEDDLSTLVWLADFDGDQAVNLKAIELTGSAYETHWSPSGDHLAIVSAPTPTVDDRYMRRGVDVYDVKLEKIVATLQTEGKLGQVCWSPSGEQIAIISGKDNHDPAEGRITIHELSGSKPAKTHLTDYLGHVVDLQWLAQNEIVLLAEEGLGSRLGTLSVEGEFSQWKLESDVVFTQFSVSEDASRLAFLGSSSNHPSEAFLLKSETKTLTRLTDHNPWLGERDFGKQVPVEWVAKDGLRLEGVLIYPLGYQAGKRYPTIMYVHGGPESHEKNAWLTSYSRPGQVAAAKGFVVFYPNYRGSTGRGVEFSMMGQGDAAGKEFQDLIDGIDFLISEGISDREAIGVTGGSYGGYASAWCSTYYSDRFAASVMFVGISDNLSKVGTTDIPEEMYLVHHRKRLWEDWDYFLERSPIRYVERNQTPTLILHGKEDPRVHPSQSLEFHRHLKTLNQAPVRSVLYPGEGHGNRRAASKFDYNLRMIRWMEHFLLNQKDTAPEFNIDYGKQLGAGSVSSAE